MDINEKQRWEKNRTDQVVYGKPFWHVHSLGAVCNSCHGRMDSKHRAVSGRDYVREFLEAFRAEGIRVGLYFSYDNMRREKWGASKIVEMVGRQTCPSRTGDVLHETEARYMPICSRRLSLPIASHP